MSYCALCSGKCFCPHAGYSVWRESWCSPWKRRFQSATPWLWKKASFYWIPGELLCQWGESMSFVEWEPLRVNWITKQVGEFGRQGRFLWSLHCCPETLENRSLEITQAKHVICAMGLLTTWLKRWDWPTVVDSFLHQSHPGL